MVSPAESSEKAKSFRPLIDGRETGYAKTERARNEICFFLFFSARKSLLLDVGWIGHATFATPAAIKDPPQEGYENIFNIINPADLVPQVMPAEWGYGRYGVDLFLPVQEFSSYEGFLDSSQRSYNNKEKYNVEYSYSSMLTLRLRLLMSLVLDLTENVENYCANFQPALVSIMHDKTVTNTVSILRKLMQNIKLTDREDKTHLDDLVDYFMRVFSGIALRSGYEDADKNTGSMLFRLMIEHTPNSYLSAVPYLRDGIFEKNSRCCNPSSLPFCWQ